MQIKLNLRQNDFKASELLHLTTNTKTILPHVTQLISFSKQPHTLILIG